MNVNCQGSNYYDVSEKGAGLEMRYKKSGYSNEYPPNHYEISIRIKSYPLSNTF